MSSVSQPCGLFGMLPQQPDFITHKLPAGFTDVLHHWLQNVIAISAEQVLLSALAEDVSYDQLVAMLGGLGSPGFRGSPSYQTDHCAVAWPLCLSVGLSGPESRAGTVLGLAEAVSRQLSGGHSLWWTSGSQRVAPVLLICTGLPDPGRFAAMLDGQWQQQGWSVPLVCEESAS